MNQMMSTLWSQLDFVCRISISLSEGASDMLTATTLKVVLGSIAFVVFWVLAVFPAVPILPIGRTAGSILGAVLMVIFQVETPNQAYAAVDLPILGLLFGTMVVSVYLERADMFKYLGKFMSWKSKGAKDLLCRICLVSAVSSALFTNDTTCVVLTEFVLKLALQHNLPPQPLLFALVSSSNIGSAATPIGNPQNLVIAVESGISFGSFLFGVLPAMVVGISVNTLLLLLMYWKPLSCPNPNKVENVISNPNPNSNSGRDDVTSHRFSTATLSRPTSLNSQEWSSVLESMSVHSFPNIIGHTGDVEALRNRVSVDSNKNCGSLPSSSSSSEEGEIQQKREETGTSTRFLLSLNGLSNAVSFKSSLGEKGNSILAPKWKRIVWKCCIYLVVVGMLIALLMGLNMSWTAITAALALVVLDFKDAKPCLEKVSYSLLIFFSGMFITMDGLNKTGIPSELWELMEPYARINKASGVAVLALVILVLSNFASNVPTVLLLGGRIAASATVISPTYERKAWLLLAWVSSVGGNLSLLGSAANLIVCEQAGRAQHSGYNLSFWSHLKFGVPSTLIVTSIGLLFIKG